MNKIKLALWVFILYIIQNVFYPIMSISGLVPDFILGFTVAYSCIEPRFKKLSPVIIVCAVIAGTGTGRVFSIVTLLTGLAGVASYLVCSYMPFIPKILRTLVITILCSYLAGVTEYFVLTKTLAYAFLTGSALWQAIYTGVVSCIIYLILNRSVNKNTQKKILIAQERN